MVVPPPIGIEASEKRATHCGLVNGRLAVVGAAVIPAAPLSFAAQTYSGWFIGSGVEYAIDFLPGLFWKTEYRYASYGAKDLPVFNTINLAQIGSAIHAQKYVQTVRSELVWRFNWGGPVVAKY